jgi:hypothetical protein
VEELLVVLVHKEEEQERFSLERDGRGRAVAALELRPKALRA